MKQTVPELAARRLGVFGRGRTGLSGLVPAAVAGLLGTLVGCGAGVAILAGQPAKVEATMLVGAAAPPAARSLDASAGTGLADRLMGESRYQRRFARFRSLLTARPAAKAVHETPDLLRALFPGRWHAGRGAWQAPGPLAGLLATAKGMLGYRRASWHPSVTEVRQRLAAGLRVRERGEASLLAVSFRHPRSAIARKVLATVQQAAAQRLAHVAARDSQATVTGLEKRLANAAGRYHRRALADLLRRYETAHIKQTSTASYAAWVLSPPSSSARPRYPRPPLVLGGFALAGLVAGAALHHAWRRRHGAG